MKMLPAPLPGQEGNTRISRGELGWVGVIMTLLALALYARTFGADWTYDDWVVIVNNPDVQSLSSFFSDSNPSRPLRELSLLLDYRLFGLNPAAWHAQNILWHALNAVLFWVLLRRLGTGRQVAWGGALLFLLHPLNVEVVASLSHRKDSLALAFSLLALLAWLNSYSAADRPWRWRLGALLLWMTALLAKQHVVLLPLVAAVWELCTLPGERRWLLRYPRLCWLAAVTVVGGGLAWFWLGNGPARYLEVSRKMLARWHEYSPESVVYYPWMVLKSWAFMGSRLVWPTPLAVEYYYPVPHTFFDPWVLAGAGVVLGFFILSFLAWRSDRRYFFGLAWFCIFWLPTSNLWPLAYFAADRYFYLPALGLFFCLVLLIETIHGSPWRQRLCWLLLLLPLTLLSWQQVRHWDNDETLYLHALAVSPQSAFVCNELGKLYYKQGSTQKAIDYFRRGQKNDPRQASIPYNLGVLYERQGWRDQALDSYRLFLSLNPSGAYADAARDLRLRLQKNYGGSF